MKHKLPREGLYFGAIRGDKTSIVALLDDKVSVRWYIRRVSPNAFESGPLLGVPWRSVVIDNVMNVRIVVEIGDRMQNHEGIHMNVKWVLVAARQQSLVR